MASIFENLPEKIISPSKLAHVVLRTHNFAKMVQFYENFLGARVIYSNDHLAFLTYDEEHHRLALLGIPGTKVKDPTTAGLEHIAFTFDTLSDLLVAYLQRKGKGINPFWPVNHGPTTSIYYKDPDGNMIETQVDNYEDADEATDFMNSKDFSENPIGVDFDPEDHITKLVSGQSTEAELKKRVEIGPRGIPDWA
ncbi:hypothetical protein VTL71DRAFT_6860 [Oculimacula yallundae]|uniref:VOC domain-containing protein n=1 Tax=Oculimacula yallundae TaxID=86028 RepID=A0ABR4BV11_9HELO